MDKQKVVLLIETVADHSSSAFAAQIKSVRAAAEELPELFDIVDSTRWASQGITSVDAHLLSRPIFVYGSIQFIRDIKAPVFPGAYGTSGTDWANTTARIPRQLLKNNDYAITTWADLYLNFHYWCAQMQGNNLFVRPVSDKKPFAGQVFQSAEYAQNMAAVDAISSVLPETLCVVAKAKKVYVEFRFFIVNREIITHTTYGGFAGTSNIEYSNEIFTQAEDIAKLVKDMEWQPDVAYTCDVTVDYRGGASLIELNSLSSAGVYNADTNKLLQAVYEQVLRDFNP